MGSILQKPETSQRSFIILIGAGFLVLGMITVPAIFDRGHVIDEILHSGGLWVTIIVALFTVILSFGLTGIQRRAADRRSPWGFYWGTIGALFILGTSVIYLAFGRDYQLAVDLTAHGIPAQARFVHQFVAGCGRSGCTTEIEYSFTPNGRTEAFHGFANEGDVTRYPSAEYRYVISTGTIPILYDTIDPSRSLVNYDDRIKKTVNAGFMSAKVKIFSGLFIFLIVMVAAMSLSAIRSSANSRRAD